MKCPISGHRSSWHWMKNVEFDILSLIFQLVCCLFVASRQYTHAVFGPRRQIKRARNLSLTAVF